MPTKKAPPNHGEVGGSEPLWCSPPSTSTAKTIRGKHTVIR
jgi:hypothetical protein